MYRHFALVTVLLTATLAMFASGENRKAVAAHVEERTQENELRRESYARFGAPKVGGEPAPTIGRFGNEESAFGKPMDNPRGGVSSSVAVTRSASDTLESLGYSPEYLETLSPLEREMLLKGLDENGLLSNETRARRAASLSAASARRSGGGDD